MAQAILQNARHAMLVADSSKLKRTAPVRIAHISQVETFVTDGLGTSPLRDICRERAIRLVEAAPELSIEE